VVAAVREQHVRRAPAEGTQLVEERLAQVRGRCRAAAVQEHEQLTAVPAAARQHEDLVQVSMSEPAVDREADDPRAAWAAVAAAQIVDRDPRGDDEHEDDCERERTPHRRRAYRR